jgi:hypothetical protein
MPHSTVVVLVVVIIAFGALAGALAWAQRRSP